MSVAKYRRIKSVSPDFAMLIRATTFDSSLLQREKPTAIIPAELVPHLMREYNPDAKEGKVYALK
jgi:hypothetical protein